MRRTRRTGICIMAAVGTLVLIFDAHTAFQGASDGIQLCIYTVVPSLFPFIVFSIMLNGALLGSRAWVLQPLGKLLGIPKGSESLLLLGLIGGYPVGAQCVHQTYCNGQISKMDAEHLLSFCNNAGPAFIFGLTTGLFTFKWTGWILWGTQILSALLTGFLLSRRTTGVCSVHADKPVKFNHAVTQSARIVASICCWVILFRLLIAVLNRWIICLLPVGLKCTVYGFLELTNGCVELNGIHCEGIRLILASMFLSAGGLCVAMQTAAVTPKLNMRCYCIGKLLQTSLCCLLASFLQYLCYKESDRAPFSTLLPLCCTAVVIAIGISIHYSKIRGSISAECVV